MFTKMVTVIKYYKGIIPVTLLLIGYTSSFKKQECALWKRHCAMDISWLGGCVAWEQWDRVNSNCNGDDRRGIVNVPSSENGYDFYECKCEETIDWAEVLREAERKRKVEEAENKRLEEEAAEEKKRIEDAEMQNKLEKEAAERKKQEEEKKKREEEVAAEKKRQEEEALKKKVEMEEAAEKKRQKTSKDYVWITVVGSVVAGLVLLLLLALALVYKFYIKNKKRKSEDEFDDREVQYFFMNFIQSNESQDRDENADEGNTSYRIPWDSLNFEIPLEDITIHWDSKLGDGFYGTVYKAMHHSNTPVAMKTFKWSSGKDAFWAQMSELKVMAQLGTHENIVNLIGAYTKEIKRRVLYIFTELCALGNLNKFLQDDVNRNRYIDLMDSNGEFNSDLNLNDKLYQRFVYVKKKMLKPFSTLDLLLWSYQIASAMEYISSKKIIHGDLAARNVLLTEDYSAKICDFGLAVHLYSKSYAKRTEKMYLPWKWMSIEAIEDYKFSTESDIWSYAVTLWEIYSLGKNPYCDVTFQEILEYLNSGKRLKSPKYATPEIYREMKSCWEGEPYARPNFLQLKNFFREKYSFLNDKLQKSNQVEYLKAD